MLYYFYQHKNNYFMDMLSISDYINNIQYYNQVDTYYLLIYIHLNKYYNY